ncbi:Hsp20/alpha crystallin family protein [Rhodococcus zopfii]|uniref:Hsp20/alpha crystallin family protein n=1 Tax=Rhodococcus zopfii TaxID=43772 RepID=UPI0035295781
MAMALPARQPRSVFPELSELFDSLRLPALGTVFGNNPIRVEDRIDEGRYIVRAELPGLDPDNDISVTVDHGRLDIHAERSEEKTDKGRSEFSYGSFHRSVTLPTGAKDDDVEASYSQGILTISIGLGEEPDTAKKIDIKTTD